MAALITICLLGLALTTPSARGLRVVRFPTKACSTGGSSRSAITAVVGTPAKAVQGFAHSDDSSFHWNKAWYPVLSEVDSDPERAHMVQVCTG